MTRLLRPDPAGLAEAAALLRSGELVAFATETVYGLGGDATNPAALAAIFAAKGRPRFNPLICHYPDAGTAFAHVQPSALAERLAARFWPGPLTLVLPRRPGCPVDHLASAGLDTLAVRVPSHPASLALLREAGCPVAAPSANRSGGVSPTRAQHVLADLGGSIAAILDCGPCPVGLESTVLDLSGAAPVLLRPGGIAAASIEALTGPLARTRVEGAIRSPGLLASHYAPRLPLRLDATEAHPNEAVLAFGPRPLASPLVWNLSEAGGSTEAAARLFAGLRWLDAEAPGHGLTAIAAMPVPREGLGEAINDRLARAAAPRD